MDSPGLELLFSMGTVQWWHSGVAGGGRKPEVVCIYSQWPNESPSFVVYEIWYWKEAEMPGISSVMTFPSGNFYWIKKTWFWWSWFKVLMLWSASLQTSILLTSSFKTPCLIHFPQDCIEEIFGWWVFFPSHFFPGSTSTPVLQKYSFSGLFTSCYDDYHCLWAMSQLPGQSLMNVIPQHCALDPWPGACLLDCSKSSQMTIRQFITWLSGYLGCWLSQQQRR